MKIDEQNRKLKEALHIANELCKYVSKCISVSTGKMSESQMNELKKECKKITSMISLAQQTLDEIKKEIPN